MGATQCCVVVSGGVGEGGQWWELGVAVKGGGDSGAGRGEGVCVVMWAGSDGDGGRGKSEAGWWKEEY